MTSLQRPPKGWREWEKKERYILFSQQAKHCVLSLVLPHFHLGHTYKHVKEDLIVWDVTCKPKRPQGQNVCQPLDNGNSQASPDISRLTKQKPHSLTGGQGHFPSATLCLLNVIRKEKEDKKGSGHCWPTKDLTPLGSIFKDQISFDTAKGYKGYYKPRHNRKVGSK